MPNFAFKNPTKPPNIAPATIPERITIGICKNAGKSKDIPTIVAAIVPAIYCPSAPILNNPVLNANPTLIPVSIIGVAFIITFVIDFGLSNTP